MNYTDMDMDPRLLAQLLRRTDFLSFLERCVFELEGGKWLDSNWHLEVIASELAAIENGTNNRLIINIPPRHLKSVILSVAFPAWLLGQNPRTQIICVSYAQDLSEKFGRDCLQILQSQWFRRLFPKTILTKSKCASSDFSTTLGGFRLATSKAGVLTGRGADYIIIDDPLKSNDAFSETNRTSLNEWYAATLVSRLNEKESGSIILVMQRLHEDDLSGELLRKGRFKHLCLPAIATVDEEFPIDTIDGRKVVGRKAGETLHPARESLETLADIRKLQGEIHFSAQYQQAPLPAEGHMIKHAWLTRYKPEELPKTFDLVFQSWDTASKLSDMSDYTVCTTWGAYQKRLYLLDVFRKKLDFPSLCDAVLDHQELHRAKTVLVEDKASGTQLVQELRSKRHYFIQAIEPVGDKVVRMAGQSVQFENGAVVLPTEAPWLSEYVRELTSFPNGKHDDQVDSTSQALNWFNPRHEVPAIIEYYRRLVEQDGG